MTTLEDYLRHNASVWPDKVALSTSDSSLTYQELLDAVCKRATEIAALPSRAYLLRASQGIGFIIDYLAAHKSGKVVVPLEKDVPEERLRDIARLTESASIPPETSDILFTTGTTGKCKGTMISQGVILADAENLIEAQGFSPELTFIITGPLNHIGSLSKIWPCLMVGASIHIMDGLKNLDAFFSAVRQSPAKVATFQVPASLRMMLRFGHRQLEESADRFDFIETGAAPMTQTDMEELCALLPHTRLYNTYASTETGIIATHDFNAGLCVAGCLGKPMKNSTLTIDAEGFICCKGKTLMLGYCGDEQETARVLHGDTIRTNDKGTLDSEGRLQLAGRDGDIINAGGFKINPVEVEDAVMSLPQIADCICVPAPHPVLGTALRLLYVVKDSQSIDKKTLARHIASRLESHKVPHLYSQVDKIERTYNGKLNRKAYL